MVTDPLPPGELRQLGLLGLAHVGDAVYELLVRARIARRGALRPADRHRMTVAWVSAGAQARALQKIGPHLTDEERDLCRRGRNAHVRGCPAGCTPAEYHAATALEALFGWLWLGGDADRAEALFSLIWED